MNNNGALLKSTTLFHIPFSLNSPALLHPNNKTHHQHSYISKIQLPKHKLLSFHLKSPSGSPLFSSKTSIKAEPSTPSSEKFDLDDETDDEFEEEEDDGDEEDEDEDIIVPLRNMRQWTRNKPLGFGEGKVYDTSVEDKLLEELEQSRVAQIANVNNLKNNPEDGNPKKEKLPKQKVPEVPPNGIRVRLINLPKKKNIHRDLQVAFKPFSGIVNIIPAVLGNEKTREPVCKGFAFVDFKSEKEANRFVDMFSTQPITFGKVQKQVRCEIVKPSPPNLASSKPSVHKTKNRLPVSNPTATINPTVVAETPFDPYVEDAVLDKFKIGDDRLVSVTDDYNDNSFGTIDTVVQEIHDPEGGSELPKTPKKVGVKGKKTIAGKKKAENTPKLNLPGSANRLKMKEKALLSGVFSKYGVVATKGTEVVTD